MLAALVLGATLVTCGPAAVDGMGDAMLDAADRFRDAGHDAAEVIRDSSADAVEALSDTGADVLDDTGAALSDVAGDDAFAQESCTTCTTTGAGRTVSAAEDPAQSVGGTVRWLGPDAATEIATGPLYLTDVEVFDLNCLGGGCGMAYGILVSIDGASRCDDVHLGTRTLPADAEIVGAAQYIGGTTPTLNATHGARILVPAGRRLCGQVNVGTSSGMRWAGFRPYD